MNRTDPTYSVLSATPPALRIKHYTLFIEMKLLKLKKDMSKATDEISADIKPYLSHSRGILFCIYDIDRNIADDDKFIEPFKTETNVFVKVIR